MSLGIISRSQHEIYRVLTPVYEGPLDLLLQLIERSELDITQIALAQVTDQYLTHIRQMERTITEEISAFLVIAAKLVQIKSAALLPRITVSEEGSEDVGDELVKQLLEYRKFRNASRFLLDREEIGWKTYLRLASPPKIEGHLDMQGIGLQELILAANSVFFQQAEGNLLGATLPVVKITIREKVHLIATTLKKHGRTHFFSLLRKIRSRLEVVVTFLAILELVKQKKIDAIQEHLFADIEIVLSGDAERIEEDLSSEFED